MINSVYQDEIDAMQRFRQQLLNKQEKEEASESDINQIESLTNDIVKYIKKYFDSLQFDFIIEQLSKLGDCPNLLNDDNGHWAVTCDGYQNVSFSDDPIDIETHFYVEAEKWKNTPREALYNYLISD